MGFLRSSSKRSVSARAQFANVHDAGLKNQLGNGAITESSSLHSACRMRVTPENGQPEFESQLSVWGNDANYTEVGRWTYVLYDPDRPDHCEIDKDRLAKEFGLRGDGKRPHYIPKDPGHPEVKITGPVADTPAPPVPASAPDALVTDLARLADLRAAGTLNDAEFAEAKARLLGSSQA